jgi:hypothetical protein
VSSTTAGHRVSDEAVGVGVLMPVNADFPFRLSREQHRAAITAAYEDPRFGGWHVAAPIKSDADDGGRRRRLGVVFALGLPGPVDFDIDAELAFHAKYTADQPDAPTVQDWSAMIETMLLDRTRYKRDEQPGPVRWCRLSGDEWDETECAAADGPGVLAYSLGRSLQDWGWQVIANFGGEGAYLSDGAIPIASSDPLGAFNPTSDNCDLPGEIAIWFACK